MAWRRFRRHRLAMLGGAFLGAIVTVCLVGPLIVPESAANRVDPTLFRAPPSLDHPFGSDDVGRDILWRIVYGGRISLAIGGLSIGLAMTIGVVLGSVSGYYGGWADSLIMRLTDAMLSMPALLLLIVLTRILGPSVPTIILVIGLLSWMQVTRMVRANFLSLKEQDFVLAARALGGVDRSIIFREHPAQHACASRRRGHPRRWLRDHPRGVGELSWTWRPAANRELGHIVYRAQGLMIQAPWVAIFPG